MFLIFLFGLLIILINVLYFIFVKNRKMDDLREIVIFHLFYVMFLNTYIVKLLSKILLLPQGYIGVKKLEKIVYLFLNTSNYISLYIGITAVLGSLLVYAASIDYSEKKHIFFESTKISYQFVLMIFNYVLFFLNVNPIFLIGALVFFIFM